MSRKKKPDGSIIHKPSKTLVRLFNREGGKCFWCQMALTLDMLANDSGKRRPTKDHVLPRSKGGTCNIVNLVLSCSGCNNKKSDKLVNPKTGWAINPHVLAVLLKE